MVSRTVKYSVIGPDGTRYGPVDLATLSQWVAEGRVLPQTMLERDDGQQMAASAVPELTFGSTRTAQAPGQPMTGQVNQPDTPYANYPRQPTYAPGQIPPELQGGWNWGAFYFSWIWGLNHKAYLTLISLGLGIFNGFLNYAGRSNPGLSAFSGVLSLGGLGLMVWYGLMGNRWAWESGRFRTVEDCKACQRIWAWWALGMFLAGCVCAVILVGTLGVAIFSGARQAVQ